MLISNNMRVYITCFFFLFCTVFSFSQEQTLALLKERFKSQKVVYLSEKEHLNIVTKDNTYSIFSDVEWEMMYLTDKGNSYSDQSIYFSKFTEIKDIKALSFLPKSRPGAFKKVKVTKFETEDVFSNSYFFHDSKKIKFTFPGTEEGTKIKLSYREKIKDPRFLGQTFFISFLPKVHSKYSVSFPSNVDLKYKMFNMEGHPIKFETTTKKGKTTYSWTVENQDAFESVRNAPNIKYYAPHLALYIGDIRLKDTTITVLPNLDALFSWYNGLVENVNLEPDSTLQNITRSLIKGLEGKDEKARIIFNWVQNNIKYVAFEDGMGGFIPRPAARVCRNRYGDCKDMSSIITEMLRYAGIESSLTWIGSRELPYDYTDIATPVVDNHMIASYRNEKDEIIYLDAVGSYTPYGYPTGFIQGKQALIRKKEGKYEVERVPIVTKEKNVKHQKMHMVLDGTKLTGKGSVATVGYSKLDFVYPLISKNLKERTVALEAMLEKGSNKFKIQKASFDGLKNRDKPLKIEYDFTIEDYVKRAGDEYYVNLNLDKNLKSSKLDIEKRNGISVEHEYKVLDQDEIELELPLGFEITYLPKNAGYSNAEFGFSIDYKILGNKVYMKKEIYINTLMLKASNFLAWNSMIKKLNKAYKDVVVLKETSKKVK